MTSGDLEPGSILASKYRVDRKLGAGGMGAVYLAENLDIGRKVALKLLLPKYSKDPETVLRFRREARAAAAIGHPGIVDVLDLGETADGLFIVMEHLQGVTLRAAIKAAGRFDLERAVAITCDILDALAAAHDKGIVHRDLKPDNIFLVEPPGAATKLLDFGVSKLLTDDPSLTEPGAILGTPLYMSPEQARGASDVGPPTDLYAVGAILYHALAGRPPFYGDSVSSVLVQVVNDAPPPLGATRPDLPPSIVSWVECALAKRALDRHRTARDAKETLLAAVGAPHAEADQPFGLLDTRPSKLPGALKDPPTDLEPRTAPETDGKFVSSPRATEPEEQHPPSLQPRAFQAPRARSTVVIMAGLSVAAGVVWMPRADQPSAFVGAPAPLESIQVELVAEPRSARWVVDGVTLDCNPCILSRSRGERAAVSVSAKGYQTLGFTASFTHRHTENVALVAEREIPDAAGLDAKGGERVTKVRSTPPSSASAVDAGSRRLTIDRTNPF